MMIEAMGGKTSKKTALNSCFDASTETFNDNNKKEGWEKNSFLYTMGGNKGSRRGSIDKDRKEHWRGDGHYPIDAVGVESKG